VEYNCSLIEVDWLDAYIELRVVGAVSSSQWDARANTGKNIPNPADQ
jgi:hypothetical protein